MTHEEQSAIYQSPFIKIGKHEWKCVVYRHQIHGACTSYHWRLPGNAWQSEKQWPSYDHNDTYNGLPKSLSRLWRKYEVYIKNALCTGKGKVPPATSQQELFI